MENRKSEEYWKEKGIKFEIIPSDKYEEVVAFLDEHYFPDEPISRSINMVCDPSYFGRMIRDQTLDEQVRCSIRYKTSFWALNENGEILGIRLGEFKTKEDAMDAPDHKLSNWLSRNLPLIPDVLYKYGYFNLCMDEIKYGKKAAFADLQDANKIYYAHILCSSKNARGLGLGKELVIRSMELANKNGCEYMYILATGMYSSRIFADLEFSVLKEMLYEDIKDGKGRLVFNDTREHKKMQVIYKKLE